MFKNMRLRWHGRFHPRRDGTDAIVLLAQDETLSLAGPQFAGVINWLDPHTSTMPTLSPQDEYVLAELLRQNLLEPGDPAMPHPIWHLPDFAAAPKLEHLGRVICLAQSGQLDWLAPLLELMPGVIVVVEDELDPRLAAIDEEMRRTRTPWLLLRQSAKQIWLGPLFTPNLKERPCWACLAWRLQHNQPARLWASRCHGALWPLPISISTAAAPTPECMARLLTSCQSLLDTSKPAHLWSIPNAPSQPARFHAVLRRPNCPACGEPGLFAAQLARPPVWQHASFLPTYDGGLRRESPATTLARLQAYVDPITGVLANLEPLPRNGNMAQQIAENIAESMVIYRAAAFVTPRQIHHWQPDPFVRMALGKGIAAQQSCVSALCEGLERFNAQYQGDEPSICAVPQALPHRAILPHQLAPFSTAQYADFAGLDDAQRASRQGVLSYQTTTPLHWTQCWSLRDQQACFLPTSYCFANTPFPDAVYCRWGSNGCAAGNSLEEAALQGLLELVERDAVAIWWYNRIPRPALDLAQLPHDALARIDATLQANWDYWVLDLTHDLAIPVMVAVGQQRESGQFILGMGCHPDAQIAALRALCELCQLLPIRNQGKAHFNFDEMIAAPYLFPAGQVTRNDTLKPDDTICSVLLRCVEKVQARDLEVILLDYSRPDIPLVTVNMAVPGLCHIWPRFGCQRLYAVPHALGWLPAALTEAELNPQALML